jgi:serine/threonine-protein kinase HipA
MNDTLLVTIDGALVGRLWLDERKQFCFQYDAGWLGSSRIPLSLSLPLRTEAYLDDISHPFFANLLPEEKIRVVIARNLGISLNNDYGLLERIGGDCAGAVSLYPELEEPHQEPGSYRRLTLDELDRVIGELPIRPLLAGEKGIRLSLAGAQKKLPVLYDGNNYHLGLGSAPSNHIIKPPIEYLDNTVENEAFCMALAHAVRLGVPGSFVHQHGEHRVFVISRYDRVADGAVIKRLHQEDFCQVLRILPEYKYETEGGATLAACFNLVRKYSTRSGKDLLSLLDWVIFNYLIGNSDAHAKNISLLLLPEGPRLAPFYDLISTRIYSHYGSASGLAMKIGGECNPDAIRKEHWEKFSEEIGFKPHLVIKRIGDNAKKIQQSSQQLFQGSFAQYKCDALYRLMQFIGEQTEKAARRVL